MPTPSKAVHRALDLLGTLGLVVYFLLIPVLSAWQVVRGLSGGVLVCPLYYHGSVVFNRHESPWSFWTVIAFWLALGSTTAMIVVKLLWRRARP